MQACESQPSIRIPARLLECAARQARASFPAEACGLLIGNRVAQEVLVAELTTGKNLSVGEQRPSFDLDPGHLVQMEAAARACGLEIVGLWHSHPAGPAVPSKQDLEAAVMDWSYLILALDAETETSLRSWRLTRTGFQEERLLA